MNKSLKIFLIMIILTFATFSGVLGTKVISEEERLTKETTAIGAISFPAIYGNIVVWADNRGGNSNIFGCNLKTKTEFQISDSGNVIPYPAIYGDIVVWSDNINGNFNIYGYNLNTQERFQVSDSGNAMYPAIYGDIVVWTKVDNNENKADIWGYNLKTKERFQITESNDAGVPAIYGDIVVWIGGIQFENTENIDIFGYNLKTKERFQITKSGKAILPEIYCDRVVWLDYRDGNIYGLLDVYITYLDVVCGETKKSLPMNWIMKKFGLGNKE